MNDGWGRVTYVLVAALAVALWSVVFVVEAARTIVRLARRAG